MLQLKAMCDPELHLGPEKGHQQTLWKFEKGLWLSQQYCINVSQLPDLIIAPWLHKMLTSGEAG